MGISAEREGHLQIGGGLVRWKLYLANPRDLVQIHQCSLYPVAGVFVIVPLGHSAQPILVCVRAQSAQEGLLQMCVGIGFRVWQRVIHGPCPSLEKSWRPQELLLVVHSFAAAQTSNRLNHDLAPSSCRGSGKARPWPPPEAIAVPGFGTNVISVSKPLFLNITAVFMNLATWRR